MPKKSNKEEFVEKAKEVHKDSKCKYTYDKFVYVNNKIKGIITCEKHGDFEQPPAKHLRGQGCPKCAKEKLRDLFKSNLGEFIDKANKIHNNFYNYSIVDYVNAHTKVKIICPIHGDFEQIPSNHLNGSGCPECAIEKIANLKRSNLEEFVDKANKVHNNFYNYSIIDYVNAYTKVKIICPIHGDFEQIPSDHLSGHGCPKCAKEKLRDLFKSNLEEFVDKANKIHNNFYDYSNVDYIHSHKKIKIICPIHGDFEQTPSSHLKGSGCPKCWRERLRELQNIKWSDRFDEGVLYLIECWNDFERFVKIGLTSKTVEERYRQFGSMPYQYKILKELRMNSNAVSDTEQYIINFYESYNPKITFGGDSECLEISEKFQIIEFLENLEKDLEVSEKLLILS